MKRVFKIRDSYHEVKYEFTKMYDRFAIYEEVTPSGYQVSQSWAIKDLENDDAAPLIIQSHNHISEAEILDAIDNYNKSGFFGFKVFYKTYGTVVHPCGDVRI